MSLKRYDPKRDSAEKVVVEYLRRRGALVERLSGRDLPDLLIGWCGRWLLLEVKTGQEVLTAGQTVWHKEAQRRGLPAWTVRSPEDAKAILERTTRLTKHEGEIR